MKRILLTVVFVCLLANMVNSQTNPLAPKEPRAQLINYLMWERIAYDFLSIPVYLSTPRDTNIRYCWYSTKTVFGEIVRTSEDPIRTEEGTYANGRLTMYKKNDKYYKFEWSSDGAIRLITIYDKNGEVIRLIQNSSSYKWYDANSSIPYYIGGTRYYYMVDELFVLTEFKNTKDWCYIDGFSVRDGYIIRKNYEHYRSNYKRKDYKYEKSNNEYKYSPISQIWAAGKAPFNFNDPIGCAYFVF